MTLTVLVSAKADEMQAERWEKKEEEGKRHAKRDDDDVQWNV